MESSHQDWETVIFRKKFDKTKTEPARPSLEPAHIRALKDDAEVFALKLFESQYIKLVLKSRIERKWSQKDLAQRLNVDISVIQKLEQGKAVYDGNLKQKLNRLLALPHQP